MLFEVYLKNWLQGVGSSGKSLGFCGLSIRFKVQIPLGANNSFRPAYMGPRFTQQEWVHEAALPWKSSSLSKQKKSIFKKLRNLSIVLVTMIMVAVITMTKWWW